MPSRKLSLSAAFMTAILCLAMMSLVSIGLAHGDEITSNVVIEGRYQDCGRVSCSILRAYGNGVVIGKRDGYWVALANWHVVRPMAMQRLDIRVINGSVSYAGTVVAAEPGDDLAAVIFRSQASFDPPEMADVTECAQVSTIGTFVNEPHKRRLLGRLLDRTNDGDIRVTGQFAQGLSGSGVYCNKKLCGLLWGMSQDGRIGYAVSYEKIRQFLKKRITLDVRPVPLLPPSDIMAPPAPVPPPPAEQLPPDVTRADLDSLKKQLEELSTTLGEKDQTIQQLERRLAEAEKTVAKVEAKKIHVQLIGPDGQGGSPLSYDGSASNPIKLQLTPKGK